MDAVLPPPKPTFVKRFLALFKPAVFDDTIIARRHTLRLAMDPILSMHGQQAAQDIIDETFYQLLRHNPNLDIDAAGDVLISAIRTAKHSPSRDVDALLHEKHEAMIDGYSP